MSTLYAYFLLDTCCIYNTILGIISSIQQQEAYHKMNEVSGGKQDIPNTSSWETLSGQSVSSLPTMHHHQTLQQDSSPTVAQVIVPTPVKLQPPMLTPTPQTMSTITTMSTVVDHCPQLGHMQQPPLITQVYLNEVIYFDGFKSSDYTIESCYRMRHREAFQRLNYHQNFNSKVGRNFGAKEKIDHTFGIS